MSKAIVISTSLRSNSFSERLAHAFEEGAKSAGHEVEFVSLKKKKIGFCIGCEKCRAGKCVFPDDSQDIVESIRTSEIIVWATPIYYYCMTGQMKTLFDRGNSLYFSDYKMKEVYLLATCADVDSEAVAGTLKGVEGWVQCFEGVRMAGTLCIPNLPKDSDISESDLKKAYDMGSSS